MNHDKHDIDTMNQDNETRPTEMVEFEAPLWVFEILVASADVVSQSEYHCATESEKTECKRAAGYVRSKMDLPFDADKDQDGT